MKKDEVIKRLRSDLNLPKFNAFIEEKNYSEEEYEKLKTDLLSYYRDYVENISADFEGGLETQDGRH